MSVPPPSPPPPRTAWCTCKRGPGAFYSPGARPIFGGPREELQRGADTNKLQKLNNREHRRERSLRPRERTLCLKASRSSVEALRARPDKGDICWAPATPKRGGGGASRKKRTRNPAHRAREQEAPENHDAGIKNVSLIRPGIISLSRASELRNEPGLPISWPAQTRTRRDAPHAMGGNGPAFRHISGGGRDFGKIMRRVYFDLHFYPLRLGTGLD